MDSPSFMDSPCILQLFLAFGRVVSIGMLVPVFGLFFSLPKLVRQFSALNIYLHFIVPKHLHVRVLSNFKLSQSPSHQFNKNWYTFRVATLSNMFCLPSEKDILYKVENLLPFGAHSFFSEGSWCAGSTVPAGTWRLWIVALTLEQCHDVTLQLS